MTMKPESTPTPVLTEDDRRVICERYFGWEHASPALLARVFGVSHQRITTLLIEGSRA